MTLINKKLLAISLLFSLLSLGACSDKTEDSSKAGGSDRHLSNSINYAKQGQYRAAILEARNSLSKNPSDKAAIHLASLYKDLGQVRSAINLLEKIENKNDAINLKLTEAYLDIQKYASAQESLTKLSEATHQSAEYLLYKAGIAGGLGKTDEAIKLFDEVLTLEPQNEKALQSAYVLALRTGNDTRAKSLRATLEEAYSSSPRSLLILANIEYQTGQYEAAEELLMNAIHNSRETDVMLPEKTATLQLLINTLTQQGRFADAVPFNKLLSESNPGFQESQEALQQIVAQIQGGDWQAAEKLLEKFKQDYPGSSAADPLLGLVSLQKGEFADADAILETAVDPETASPLMVGASVLSKLKNNEKLEALAILEDALRTKPDNGKLLAMYGALSLEIPDKKAAGEEAMLKALKADPGNTRVYGTLAEYYFREGKKAQAIDTTLQAHEYNPGISGLQYAIVRNLYRYDAANDAKNFVEKLKQQQPQSASTWGASALTRIQENNFKAAAADLEKARKLDKNHYPAWAMAAAMEIKLDNIDNALKLLEDASKIFPDSVNLHSQSAQIYLSKNNTAKAKEKVAALEKLEAFSDANFVRANILHTEGRTEEAYNKLMEEWQARPQPRTAVAILRYANQIQKPLDGAFLSQWSELAATNPQAQLAIGNAYLGLGDNVRALASFERVIDIDANNIIALNNAAWFHHENGNMNRALELANHVLTLAPESAAVLDTVGWIKFNAGEKESVKILEKAVKLAPEAQEIKAHLAEAKKVFSNG